MASSAMPSASVRTNNPIPEGLIKMAKALKRFRSVSERMRRDKFTPLP